MWFPRLTGEGTAVHFSVSAISRSGPRGSLELACGWPMVNQPGLASSATSADQPYTVIALSVL